MPNCFTSPNYISPVWAYSGFSRYLSAGQYGLFLTRQNTFNPTTFYTYSMPYFGGNYFPASLSRDSYSTYIMGYSGGIDGWGYVATSADGVIWNRNTPTGGWSTNTKKVGGAMAFHNWYPNSYLAVAELGGIAEAGSPAGVLNVSLDCGASWYNPLAYPGGHFNRPNNPPGVCASKYTGWWFDCEPGSMFHVIGYDPTSSSDQNGYIYSQSNNGNIWYNDVRGFNTNNSTKLPGGIWACNMYPYDYWNPPHQLFYVKAYAFTYNNSNNTSTWYALKQDNSYTPSRITWEAVVTGLPTGAISYGYVNFCSGPRGYVYAQVNNQYYRSSNGVDFSPYTFTTTGLLFPAQGIFRICSTGNNTLFGHAYIEGWMKFDETLGWIGTMDTGAGNPSTGILYSFDLPVVM